MSRRQSATLKAKRGRKSTPGTFTPEKQAQFLELYAKGLTVGQAARKVKISNVAIYKRVRNDAEFAKAYEEARESNTDELENIVHNLAVAGRDKVCCFFLLKARRPHIYRDNVTMQHTGGTEFVSAFVAAMARVNGNAIDEPRKAS